MEERADESKGVRRRWRQWRRFAGARRVRGWIAVAVVGILVAQACASESEVLSNAPPDVAYVYDELGRLRAVSDLDAETIVYSYDQVGNLVGFERYGSDEVSVIDVSPPRAAPGAQVTVLGTGFDRKADKNTVTFGAMEAEVLQATPVELRVAVPDDAASGPVVVTADGESAEAADEFEVMGGQVPVVEDVSPEVVAPGEEVVIRGRGFTGDPLLDQVFLDGGSNDGADGADAAEGGELDDSGAVAPSGGGEAYLTVVSASQGELRAIVPRVASSGRVSVATPYGTASSEGVLRVVPPVERPSASSLSTGLPAEGELELLTPDDVGGWVTTEARNWVGEGEPTDVEIPAGRVGLVTFTGRARQRVKLDLAGDGLECSDVQVGLVAPGGLALGAEGIEDDLAQWCGGGGEEAAVLPWDGQYLLVIEPREGASGRVPVVLDEAGSLREPERLSPEALAERDQELEDLLGEPVEGFTDAGPAIPGGGLTDGVERFGVDLSTGMLQVAETDLIVDDLVPLELTRGYRPVYGSTAPDAAAGEFGLGSDLSFDVELDVSAAAQSASLNLAGGMTIPYQRVSDGTDRSDALLEHLGTPTAFYRSKIVWNGWGWDLTLEDGTMLSFVDGRLWAISDAYGNRLIVDRETSRDQLGRLSTGRVSTLFGPTGRWVTFAYDDQDRVVEARSHLGDTLSYSYRRPSGRTSTEEIFLESHGLISSVEYQDAEGQVLGEVTYGYDDHNRLASVGDSDGELLTIGYDDEGRVSSQTLSDGARFTFGYEAETVTVDHPIEEGETVEVDRVTQAEVTDPTDTLRSVDFADGHWVTDTWAVDSDSEQTFTAGRDPDTGFVTQLIEPGGLRTAYGYDSDGNLVSIQEDADDPDEAATFFNYGTDRFELQSITGPDGLGTRFFYNGAGSVTNEVHPGDLQTAYGYDPAGRVTAASDPAGATTGVDYELAHRVTVTGDSGSDQTPSSSVYQGRHSEYYDAAGRLASVTDTAGGTTLYDYDAGDQLVSTTDPAGSETAFAYDGDGNLTSLTDEAGNTTGYAYDDAGNLIERTDPDGATDEYSYDEAGRVIAHVDRRGVETTYEYDDLSRLSRIAYGVTEEGDPESTITYTYDPSGHLISADDSTYGTVSFAYDKLGRLVSETTPGGEVTYGYDVADRRTAMRLPDGTETAYGYDETGRLTSISQDDVLVEASWDEHGRVERLDMPNDVTASYTYDELSRLLRIDYGSSIGALRYDYDTSGRQTGASGDLARTELPGGLEDEPTYGTGNEMTSWEGQQLVYDEAGNLIDDGTNTYTWNARGQLVSISGETEASFSYDPLGRRAEATFDGETTSYLYDGENVAQQTTTDGTFTFLTGLALDEIYARTDSDGETVTYVTDAQGSVIGLAGPGGDVGTSYTYTPHGQRGSDGNDDPNTFGFTGREHDPSGLIYYRARYYDPDLGRFISEDPIGFEAGDTNLYRYVFGDPVNFTDPTGLQPGPGAAPEAAGIAVCVATGYWVMEEAFKVHDRMQEAGEDLIDGRITNDEHLLILDQGDRRAHELLGILLTVCGAAMELSALYGLGSLGLRLGQKLGPKLWQRIPKRFPGLKPKPGLRPGGTPTPRPVPKGPGTKPTPPGTHPQPGLRPGQTPRGPGGRPTRTPSGAPCSFAADTDVLLADGTTEDISDIQPGDLVYATDPVTGEHGARQVTDTWVHTDTLVDLHTTAGDITTTADHPFWNETDRQWQPAEDLSIGDELTTATSNQPGTATDGTVVVLGITPASPEQAPAHTLTVADLHTFHIQAGTSDHHPLVHNCSPKPFVNRHGQLTNGTYTVDAAGMASHQTGSLGAGKSQWLSSVDAETAVLDAARLADEAGLWTGNKARVPVLNGPVGTTGYGGELTNWITVHRTRSGFVHGHPSRQP